MSHDSPIIFDIQDHDLCAAQPMTQEVPQPRFPVFIPGTQPPGDPKLATDAEMAAAEAARKKRAPRNVIKRKTEAWTKARLKKLLNAEVKKNADHLHTSQSGGFYRTSTGVDYSAKVWLGGGAGEDMLPRAWPCEVEVKGVNSGSFPLKNLSGTEVKYLETAREFGLAMISLVWCQDSKVTRGFWIPWRSSGKKSPLLERLGAVDWADLMVYLNMEAMADKRYKGMSIREKDLKYLEADELRKLKGRWQPPPWMVPILPASIPQPLF